MPEVVSKTGESLPNNFEKISATPNAFFIYLKTQLAAFAKVLAYYERDALITDLAESQLVLDTIKSVLRAKMKPVLVRDADATDEEVQAKFKLTGMDFRSMKAEIEDFDFESLREETADCYLDLETFASEFGEKMCAIIKKLECKLNIGTSDYMGDKWLDDYRLDELINFIKQLNDCCEDYDPCHPGMELYRATIAYFYGRQLSTAIFCLQEYLEDMQEDKKLGIKEKDDKPESVVASKLADLEVWLDHKLDVDDEREFY